MPNTPILALPYPANTDPLANAAAAIQALATAIDGREKAWATLTSASTSGSVRWRMTSGLIIVEANVGHASIANAGTLALVTPANAIPVGYRPATALYTTYARMNGGTGVGQVLAGNDGSITLVNNSGAAVTTSQFRYVYALG